ncbi:MAG: 50S ribosomal protein L6 [Denitrovibrio sp.]|nr:MAG: 50S ribosomal protein L6 [Denitrovibrio sp.]
MSRIGKLPIEIPAGVKVDMKGKVVSVEGPKGKLAQDIHYKAVVKIEDNVVTVSKVDETKLSKSVYGLTRTLINNMVIGVTQGYEKKLEIIGVGYRVSQKGANLDFALGFSHPVEVVPPAGIELVAESQTKIVIKGIDKQLVGQIAANIRELRPPEPYKGKGIRYLGEYVIKKAGKTGK